MKAEKHECDILINGAGGLPVIDYHNHLKVKEIREDRRFHNLYELWIEPDPYKYRAMRMCGVPERCITGDAEPEEKFAQWCRIFPKLAGAAGGYAAIGNSPDMASLAGSYSRDGVAGLVTQGPAWWWRDHSYGMRRVLCDWIAEQVLRLKILKGGEV